MRNNQASATAILIVRSIGFVSYEPTMSQFIPEDMKEINSEFLKQKPLAIPGMLKAFQWKWFRSLIWSIQQMAIPGMFLHYILRKRYIEEETHKAISHGIRQVVICAAGFDSLAVRLHKTYPDVHFIKFRLTLG